MTLPGETAIRKDTVLFSSRTLLINPWPMYQSQKLLSATLLLKKSRAPPYILTDSYNVLFSGDSAKYVSGALTSLSYVLTLSFDLAQMPPGPPSPSHLRVYAGLTELSLMDSSDHRDVLQIKVSHTPYILYVKFNI